MSEVVDTARAIGAQGLLTYSLGNRASAEILLGLNDVGAAFVQPGQEPRQALLDRVRNRLNGQERHLMGGGNCGDGRVSSVSLVLWPARRLSAASPLRLRPALRLPAAHALRLRSALWLRPPPPG